MGRDLNDVLREEGPGAVRARLDNAAPFKPNGATAPQQQSAELKADESEINNAQEAIAYAPEFTEDGLALAFADAHHEKVCWVEEWNRWMIWNGVYWRKQRTRDVYDLVRHLCRNAAVRAADLDGGKRLAAELNSAKKRAAVETIARSDRRLVAVSEQWDADDWLLGTPAGIIDLRTGQNIGFDPLRYIVRTTTVGPGGGYPLWLRFLQQVTKGDSQKQAYLKRLFGYCLTGITREHCLIFFYGPGGNGKGVTLSTITGILGELHKAADVETFAERQNPAHSQELARLAGARLVTSQETRKGQYWDEPRLKKLTGGDPVTAHFMRCNDFEYIPKFKLILVGNHKPKFRSVDEAIKRRLHLVPFDYAVPKEQKDLDLAEKLRSEWPGILAWMIEGCLEWQQTGLDAPESVLQATADYLDSEDVTGQWLANRARLTPMAKTSLKALFESWGEFCELAGIKAKGTSRDLAAELEKRLSEGSKYTRKGIAHFKGIELKNRFELSESNEIDDSELF